MNIYSIKKSVNCRITFFSKKILLILLIILIFSINKAPSRIAFFYRAIIICSFIEAFLDFFTVWTNQFTDIPLPLVINNILAVIHIIFVGSAPMMYFLFIVAAAFQFIHSDVLLFGFSSVISLMVVSFALKSPQELIDQNLGSFNRTAFKDFFIPVQTKV